MKRLVLMRHGHSPNVATIRDHDRPLSPKGHLQAKQMAQHLNQYSWNIDLALVSTATRTAETWSSLQQNLHQPTIRMHLEAQFYLSGLGALQTVLGQQEPCTILALGHNNGWSSAIERLCGHHIILQTAALVVLEHPASTWNDAIYSDQWTLSHHLSPHEYR